MRLWPIVIFPEKKSQSKLLTLMMKGQLFLIDLRRRKKNLGFCAGGPEMQESNESIRKS